MSKEIHHQPEFAYPQIISRPLNTVVLWETKKANKHFSPVHRIGALSDDLSMMRTSIAEDNALIRMKIQQTARNHAHKIITASRFYQRRLGRELEILASLKPQEAARTSKYLTDILQAYAKNAQRNVNERRQDQVASQFGRIAKRLGVAYSINDYSVPTRIALNENDFDLAV